MTNSTAINYQALREIAKQATQGEWCAFISSGTGTYAVHTPGDKRCEDVIKWPGFDGQKNAENNARYIAAFNPAVVLALLDELEGKDKLIAELGKQCAEWERKASSNFEECAAMAERIEELEKTTTGQDANINSQQEHVAQSANRHVYHYSAVSNVSGITMSGIAQSPFRIKSQSDLEEFKSALSKVCGFHATAVTSLSYLGREEEE
ncbi:TPA: ead/Ea22-like family protein [Escherichia coli]|nr:ead/Ea22-like family protein [Escherichia coli]